MSISEILKSLSAGTKWRAERNRGEASVTQHLEAFTAPGVLTGAESVSAPVTRSISKTEQNICIQSMAAR